MNTQKSFSHNSQSESQHNRHQQRENHQALKTVAPPPLRQRHQFLGSNHPKNHRAAQSGYPEKLVKHVVANLKRLFASSSEFRLETTTIPLTEGWPKIIVEIGRATCYIQLAPPILNVQNSPEFARLRNLGWKFVQHAFNRQSAIQPLAV
jgi:hypothetical protein